MVNISRDPIYPSKPEWRKYFSDGK